MVKIHSPQDFEGMRKAGKLAAQVLDHIGQFVKPGVSTLELNNICHDMIIENNAIPAPLGYKGFPKSICTSVNHVICHGIPSAEKILAKGDIINIDVTVIVDGWHGDTSRMFIAGKPRNDGFRICKATYLAMMAGISAVKPGATLRDIAKEIEYVANSYKYSLVKEFTGHGLGKVFHDDPQVLHYNDTSSPYQDMELQEGMFFTIEPMVNQGTWKSITSKHDGWTATTRDKKLSAQFEHSLAVTKDGYEIFTLSQNGSDCPVS